MLTVKRIRNFKTKRYCTLFNLMGEMERLLEDKGHGASVF